jgi:IS1 family transposase
MTYNGCLSGIVHMVKSMLVRGIGIRDVSAMLKISIATVLNALKSGKYEIKPKGSRYDRLETDEFWTHVGKKKTKVRLIYACHRESGDIVAYVWGKRGLKTAKKLRKRLRRLGASYGRMAMDDWGGFVSAFGEDNRSVGKERAVGMEGSNCRLRHRMRRVFRKACRFSKKPQNHWNAFNMAFFSINYGFV